LGQRTENDTVLSWLGSFGPAMSALMVTGLSEGRDGLRGLLSRLFLWRVGLKWYLVSLLLIPVVGLTIAILYVQLNGLASELPEAEYWHSTLWQQILIWVAGIWLGVTIAPGEELGWRGYALPRLQARVHPLAASMLLGLLWGMWHFDGLIGNTAAEYSLVQVLGFLAGTVSASVIYTWLFNNTKGSVLIASIFHAAYDITVIWVAAILPIAPSDMWIGLVGLAAIALAIILLAGPRLSYPALRRTEEPSQGH
jgi:membrane protease YdiL (CAAX protease family)